MVRILIRIFTGAGLFAFGYLVGKEIGRAESIRDQLRSAAEDDGMPTELGPGRQDKSPVNPGQHPIVD